MRKIDPIFSFTIDGAMVNIYHANNGDGLPKHSHSYAHATFCNTGKCLIKTEKKNLIIDCKSNPIRLKQNDWHEIEAIEDGTIFVNVFSSGKI